MVDFDEDLIRALQLDGRAQFSAIAAQIGVHRALVAQRVHELLESGEVRVLAAVHPRLLGFPVQAHLMVRISGPIEPVFETLRTHGNVVYLSEITGSSQAAIEVWASSREDLGRAVTAIQAIPGVGEVLLTLYDRVVRTLLLGEEPELSGLELDEFDVALMSELQLDGRLTFGELSRRTGRSVSACRARVLRLLETRVMQIGAVRARQDSSTGVLFGVGVLAGGAGDPVVLERWLKALPGVEFVARTVGRYSLLATIGARSIADHAEIVRALRSRPGVTLAETWIHASVWTERYEWSLDRLARLQAA